MARRKIRYKFPRQRTILSDTLPFELPACFSNRRLFTFLTANRVQLNGSGVEWCALDDRLDAVIRMIFGVPRDVFPTVSTVRISGAERPLRRLEIASGAFRTVPFEFRVSHKQDGFRSLVVAHPRNQVAVAEFFHENASQITYFASLSPFSIRKPYKVAKLSYFREPMHREERDRKGTPVEVIGTEYEQMGSFFKYDRHSNINQFFESHHYHNSEKKYEAMLRLDISKCFDSIYTHSIAWSLLGKQAVKDNLGNSKSTFPGRFDALLQNLNQGETNGIVIGPEYSRVFAELVLQDVDVSVEAALRQQGIHHKRNYQIFRYVDDYFVFYNEESERSVIVTELMAALREVKLSVNEEKTAIYHRPIITEMTIAKDRVANLFNDELVGLEASISDESNGVVVDTKTFSINVSARSLIIKYKTILKESRVEYGDILNYSFAVIENKVEAIAEAFCSADSGGRDNRQLCRSLSAIVEFSFFLYAASPRVNHSVRICRIISHIISLFRTCLIGAELKHIVLKEVNDNIVHQLKKNRQRKYREVESLYLLLAMDALGREYRLEDIDLAQYFGISVGAGGDFDVFKSPLTYLQIVVGLVYMRDKVRYARLSAAFEQQALALLERRRPWCGVDAEALMLSLDLMVCPYIDQGTKDAAAAAVGLNSSEQAAIFAVSDGWFTAWSGFDFGKELDAKRSRDVY